MGGETTPVGRFDQFVVFALNHDRRRADRPELPVYLIDCPVGGKSLARKRFQVAVGHVDRQDAVAVFLHDWLRMECFAVGTVHRERCEELAEGRVGDLPDDRKLQKLNCVRLHFGEAFDLLTGGGGVDEHETTDLARIALRESK
jgi:hypothetical protein